MKITALFLGAMGIRMVINGVFRGAGKTITTMIISIIAFCVLRIPIAYILSNTLGWKQSGIWWGIAASDGISAVISIVWIKLSNWSDNVLVDKEGNDNDD